MAHNFIRDTCATVLKPALSLAGYMHQSSKIETETNHVPLSDPYALPYDLSFNPDPNPTIENHCSCPYTTVGADLTITHSIDPSPLTLTADVESNLTANADKHLQLCEKSKFMRDNKTISYNNTSFTIPGETIIRELVDANTILIPFAIDPHGRFGPILQSFLTTPSSTIPEPSFPHTRPFAHIMHERATKHPAPTGILLSADAYWKTHKTRKYYGHSHTAPTAPQISTLQNLGLGITKAFSLHIRNGILRSRTNTSSSTPTDTTCTTNNPSLYAT